MDAHWIHYCGEALGHGPQHSRAHLLLLWLGHASFCGSLSLPKLGMILLLVATMIIMVVTLVVSDVGAHPVCTAASSVMACFSGGCCCTASVIADACWGTSLRDIIPSWSRWGLRCRCASRMAWFQGHQAVMTMTLLSTMPHSWLLASSTVLQCKTAE